MRTRPARVIGNGIGHVTRIGASTGLLPTESAALMNEVQRFAVEQTRLGIPVIVHEESTGGYCARGATVFPQAIGLASTWDEALVAEVADVIRQQLVAVGARQALAPVLDVARDPRWGRVEETYGEDPVPRGPHRHGVRPWPAEPTSTTASSRRESTSSATHCPRAA